MMEDKVQLVHRDLAAATEAMVTTEAKATLERPAPRVPRASTASQARRGEMDT